VSRVLDGLVGVTQYKRTCVKCRCSKPVRGAVTYPKFVCAECRPKAVPAGKVAAR
jgi:hypothetical protein